MTGWALPEGTPGELLVAVAVPLRSSAVRRLGAGMPSRSRQRASFCSRQRLPSRGSRNNGSDGSPRTCNRKRRMNSSADTVMNFCRSRADNPSRGNARRHPRYRRGGCWRWRRGACITADVIEHLFRPGEGRLGKDDPLGPSQRRQIAPESFAIAEALQVGEELELAGVEGFLQVPQEQASEQA